MRFSSLLLAAAAAGLAFAHVASRVRHLVAVGSEFFMPWLENSTRPALSLLLLFHIASPQAQPLGGPLTLPRALARAESANAALRAARSELAAAEGEASEAAAPFFHNPELAIDRSRRRTADSEAPGARFREDSVALSQALEVAGQQRHRRGAARHSVAAVRAQIEDAALRLRSEVEAAFARILVLQRRLAAEEQNLALAEDAAAAVEKRISAGEDTRLDGNLAGVEAERARNQVHTTREQLIEARGRLGSLLQLDPAVLPEVIGDLPERISVYRFDDLLAGVSRRPQMVALSEREAAAGKRLDLERASAFPDVTVGIGSAREGPPEARERVTTLSVTLPLPFFNRNQAGIGRALTERDQARIEREAAVRDGEAAVRELWQRAASLQARVERLAQMVLPRLEQNLGLSRRAYSEGEIGILEMVLVHRQALDARRDYLDALWDFTQTRIAVEQAAAVHARDPLMTGASSSSLSR